MTDSVIKEWTQLSYTYSEDSLLKRIEEGKHLLIGMKSLSLNYQCNACNENTAVMRSNL